MVGHCSAHPVRRSACLPRSDLFLLFDQGLSNESVFTQFIDNERTFGHYSIVFGLRELNSNETAIACSGQSSPSALTMTFNGRFSFTSNYRLRVFTSACYYLDTSHQWRSDGMRVSRETT